MSAPDIVASALLVICDRYGGHHQTVDVTIGYGRDPVPYLGVSGTLVYPQHRVITACEQGWLELNHDADTGSLTVVPTTPGRDWIRQRRTQRGPHQ